LVGGWDWTVDCGVAHSCAVLFLVPKPSTHHPAAFTAISRKSTRTRSFREESPTYLHFIKQHHNYHLVGAHTHDALDDSEYMCDGEQTRASHFYRMSVLDVGSSGSLEEHGGLEQRRHQQDFNHHNINQRIIPPTVMEPMVSPAFDNSS